MLRQYINEILDPLPISILYVLIGGMWVFTTLFFFSQAFPDQMITQRWEWVACFSGLLLTAGFLYAQIRQTEKTLENSGDALFWANRALKVRSKCSHILIRATEERELMEKICRTVAEAEGYLMAWVGLAEKDSNQTVRPVAQWGHEKGYLETLRLSWGDNEHGRGPTGIAIRSGQPCIVQHILTDPKWEIWREKALRFGYASSISLPLADDSGVFGALVIFAGEPEAFNTREVQLLEGLAEDLSYGITTLRMRKERDRGKRERMLLATIVEQETDGVLTFDPAGKIQYVNPAFERISGYRRVDIMGCDIRSFGKDGPNEPFFRTMVDCLAGGRTSTDHFINQRPDGTFYDIESRISPVCGTSGISAFAAVVRDLTHEVQLERQLCQAQKMEAIATLTDGIAHDFNNILAAIINNSEMALDHAPEGAVLREHLAIILKAGFRARNLVKQILTLSCQGEKEQQPVRLDAIVGECLKLLRASLPATIEIRYHTTEGLGETLADPTQIHQVVMNLCTNAADAMRDKGGVLDIRVENIDLEENDPRESTDLPAGRYLCLKVADTGHGMDRKIMERIFDPFFTTKGPGRGTGLGLSVVHGIVKNHHGGIAYTSEQDLGTTFRVFLPRTEPTEVVPEEKGPIPIQGGTECILFLDDEEDLVFAGQKMLETLGYEVVAGTDSLEALDVFRAQPDSFDLIITDQTMPRLTGERLAREALRLRPDLPIILCSGLAPNSAGAVTETAARAAGIREVMMKPMERSELARAIRRALDENPSRKGYADASNPHHRRR